MIETTKNKPATGYLIRKRGLFYRPNSSGYTGIRDEAGRYTLEEALRHNMPEDGVSYVHEDDAPEYSINCCSDVRDGHKSSKLKAALDRIAELEARLDVYVQRDIKQREFEGTMMGEALRILDGKADQ